jgi:GntR family transcriptional regulator, transcriptional repressor for pyruvate dehydrogenase complex
LSNAAGDPSGSRGRRPKAPQVELRAFELDIGTELAGRRRPAKASEVLARDLARYVIAQNLVEGTKLPTEAQMIQTFGVGRSTVREALRLLETRGLITVRTGANGGPAVRRPRPSDLSQELSLLLHFEGTPLRDVLLTRQAIEPVVTRLAAGNVTPDFIQELELTVSKMKAGAGAQEVFTATNRDFHGAIARTSGNVILSIFSESLKWIADGVMAGVRYSARRHLDVAAAHEEIIEALRAGDGDSAESAMREHLAQTARYWQHKYPDLLSDSVTWSDSSG